MANEQPIFLGEFKGSAKVYFPHLVVSDVMLLGAFSTNGEGATIVNSAESATASLMNDNRKRARQHCKNSNFYALDQLEVKYHPLDYKHIFTSMTANAVCLNQ
jgi:hypothetical protein